jgi:hypothetical protein
MMGNYHVRFRAGEKTEIISNSYLLLYVDEEQLRDAVNSNPLSNL